MPTPEKRSTGRRQVHSPPGTGREGRDVPRLIKGQRRFPRYAIRLPFLHTTESSGTDRAEMGWTRNMGEGGACVELTESLRPQRPIRVRLQTAKGAIELQASVVWSKRTGSSGSILHGVAFTQVAPQQLECLRELFHVEGFVRHAGVRWPLDFPITCRPKDITKPSLQGRTGDISRGGLLLLLPEAQPVGTKLEVTIQASKEPLTVVGEVAWVEESGGRISGGLIRHGLRFTSLGPSLSAALGLLLAEPL